LVEYRIDEDAAKLRGLWEVLFDDVAVTPRA